MELSMLYFELGAGRPWNTETRFAQADGRVRREEVRLQGLIDATGQLIGLVRSLKTTSHCGTAKKSCATFCRPPMMPSFWWTKKAKSGSGTRRIPLTNKSACGTNG